MNKLYLIRCDYCAWKRVTNGKNVDDLHEIKATPVPLGFPKFDKAENKVIDPLYKEQRKRFRCPGCGRTIVVRDYVEQKDANETKDRIVGDQTGIERS